MAWHYVADGAQHGPVDDAELDRLVAAGVVTPDTQVWRAGMATWAPLRDARPAALAPEALQPMHAVRSLTELPPPSIDPEYAYSRIVAEGRQVRILESLQRGWALVLAQPGESIGVSVLVLGTMIAAGLLPCVGAIGQIVASGPLVGGWYLYFLKRLRGQHTEWADAWAGFSSPMLLQLVLQYLLTTAATLTVLLPVLGAFFLVFLGAAASAAAEDGRLAALPILGLSGVLLVAFAAMTYLAVAWVFALPLIIDKQLPFWPAMKLSWRVAHQQFLPLLGLFLLCGLVYLAGFLALCVGIFLALPVCMASLAYAYEDLFGERPAA